MNRMTRYTSPGKYKPLPRHAAINMIEPIKPSVIVNAEFCISHFVIFFCLTS
ncbi:hypothetical protein [Paenibacillus xylanilyticus]|uniref:hypothetical protein n=1 Tax=Paenibacillus xylanilyticus TaxID=248903 RepID=UPI001FE49D63|nr:hypothetical protein [Paenibacillus xylanilyticus]